MARLGAGLTLNHRCAFAPISALPRHLQERLAAEGIESNLRIDFNQPPAPRCHFIHRSHPLIVTLASDLLERSVIAKKTDTLQLATLGRMGVWRSPAVSLVTSILLLRLRHQISLIRGEQSQTLLVEQALAVAWQGRNDTQPIQGDELWDWLAAPAQGNLPAGVRQREMQCLLQTLSKRQPLLEQLADQQAQTLLADHRRVRSAANARGRYEAHALKPLDVIGAYVLLPAKALPAVAGTSV